MIYYLFRRILPLIGSLIGFVLISVYLQIRDGSSYYRLDSLFQNTKYHAEEWNVGSHLSNQTNVTIRNNLQMTRERFASTELGTRKQNISSLINTYDDKFLHGYEALTFFENFNVPRQITEKLFSSLGSFSWFLLSTDLRSFFIKKHGLNLLLEQLWWNLPRIIGLSSSTDKCNIQTGLVLSTSAMELLLRFNINDCLVTPLTTAQINTHLRRSHLCQFDSSLPLSVWMEQCIKVTLGPQCESLKGISTPTSSTDQLSSELRSTELKIMKMEDNLQNYFQPKIMYHNRYQVPLWNFIDGSHLFFDGADNNFELLESRTTNFQTAINRSVERLKSIKNYHKCTNLHAYQHFEYTNGMKYIADFKCSDFKDQTDRGTKNDRSSSVHQIHFTMPIYSSRLLDLVSFMKESSDIIMVFPLEFSTEIKMARMFLLRHCSFISSGRKIQILIVYNSAFSNFSFKSQITPPKKRCKALKSGELKIEFLPTTRTQNNLVTYVGEALNLYGPKNLFIAINPYMDFQPEFLDHVCLNTIRGFQVFFPIPFVEFKRFSPRSDNKTNSGRVFPNSNHINTISQPYFSDELHLNNNSSSFEISKNYGFFDTTDFTVAAFYGSDFLALRSDQQKCSDLTNCFLSQNGLHVLRSVEPSLRIPYHNVNCTLLYGNRSSLLLERCLKHKRWKMGTRAQLANLFFSL